MNKTTKGRLLHVYTNDPALDVSDTRAAIAAARKFTAERNPDVFPVKPGQQLVVFELARLGRKDVKRIMSMGAEPDAAELAVSLGLKGYRGNWTIDGQAVALTFTTDSPQRLDEATLDAIYDYKLFDELAEQVLKASGCDPT